MNVNTSQGLKSAISNDRKSSHEVFSECLMANTENLYASSMLIIKIFVHANSQKAYEFDERLSPNHNSGKNINMMIR